MPGYSTEGEFKNVIDHGNVEKSRLRVHIDIWRNNNIKIISQFFLHVNSIVYLTEKHFSFDKTLISSTEDLLSTSSNL